MSLTAWLLAHSDPDWTHVSDWQRLQRMIVGHPATAIIFDPADFLATVEPELPGERLAVGWEVTSDSIAARIAQLLEADELVLLKAALPTTHDLAAAAQTGFVDTYFPRVAASLHRVRAVDLQHGGEMLFTTTSDRPRAGSVCERQRPGD
jgi:hypothetical protein